MPDALTVETYDLPVIDALPRRDDYAPDEQVELRLTEHTHTKPTLYARHRVAGDVVDRYPFRVTDTSLQTCAYRGDSLAAVPQDIIDSVEYAGFSIDDAHAVPPYAVADQYLNDVLDTLAEVRDANADDTLFVAIIDFLEGVVKPLRKHFLLRTKLGPVGYTDALDAYVDWVADHMDIDTDDTAAYRTRRVGPDEDAPAPSRTTPADQTASLSIDPRNVYLPVLALAQRHGWLESSILTEDQVDAILQEGPQ